MVDIPSGNDCHSLRTGKYGPVEIISELSLLKMVIFHSYVKLPEGNYITKPRRKLIWGLPGLPKIGVPPVLIHFIDGFAMK